MGQVADSESAYSELEAVLTALARNPRLAKLLKFVSERSLQGRTEEINEYSIATEVFDRSKATFDGSTDSIVRVETFRLRKRLKEYYETEGKDHAVVISLPVRSYVPEFHCRNVSLEVSTPSPISQTTDLRNTPFDSSAAEGSKNLVETTIHVTAHPRSVDRRKRIWLYGLTAAAFVILLGFGVREFILRMRSAHPENLAAASPRNDTQLVTPPNAAHVPLRLLAGYQGSPKIDSSGAYWEADRYFSGGAAFERPHLPVSRTSDPMLFDQWRTGEFSYDIPLAPGPYELHLFFVASPPEDFKTQFFNVSANGELLLSNFNINADALGTNIADEKIFKDIHPDKDGYLHLKFFMGRSAPSLNAIEILPGLPHRQQPVRLVMQPTAVRDHSGNLWHSDNYFSNGATNDQPRTISGTPDPNLYAWERYGHFTYSIPVDTRGRYTLVLHFAELYWTPETSGSVGVGRRVFRVYCNGSTLLDDFDIFKEVGTQHALTKTFHHLRPSQEGKLDLTFDPIVNYATISAIEVIDESE
ncbi:malectin [Terriglobus albidus]|uniref:malectin n=1 Tax=Terriglobus albidus TaxID=1592106 RepID=UPI0021E0AD83|nr:malectin [Terriglobus albidus]